jgi:hypothetical protein
LLQFGYLVAVGVDSTGKNSRVHDGLHDDSDVVCRVRFGAASSEIGRILVLRLNSSKINECLWRNAKGLQQQQKWLSGRENLSNDFVSLTETFALSFCSFNNYTRNSTHSVVKFSKQ